MYSPKIKDSQLKRILVLSKKFKVPMTQIVRTAIEEYLRKYEAELGKDRKTPQTDD